MAFSKHWEGNGWQAGADTDHAKVVISQGQYVLNLHNIGKWAIPKRGIGLGSPRARSIGQWNFFDIFSVTQR